jgi:hypothetical protein
MKLAIPIRQGAWYPMKGNLKIVWAEFSTLSWKVLFHNNGMTCTHPPPHLLTWKLGPGFVLLVVPGNTKGESITLPLASCLNWFGIRWMTTEYFCFYLQNRLIQTSQTGGQWYSDSSPFSIPCRYIMYGFCSKLVCLSKPVEETDNKKDTGLIRTLVQVLAGLTVCA